MQEKIQNKFSLSEISALELVVINSPDSNENSFNGQSMY